MQKKMHHIVFIVVTICSLLAGFYLDIFSSIATSVQQWHQNYQRERILANWEANYKSVLKNMNTKLQKQEEYVRECETKLEQDKALKHTLTEKYQSYDQMMLEFMRNLENLKAPSEQFTFAHHVYDKNRAKAQSALWAQGLILLREKIKATQEAIRQREKNVEEMRRQMEYLKAQMLDMQIKGERVLARKNITNLPQSNNFSCADEIKEAQQLLTLLETEINKTENKSVIATSLLTLEDATDKEEFLTLESAEKILHQQQEVNKTNEVEMVIDEYRKKLNSEKPSRDQNQQ